MAELGCNTAHDARGIVGNPHRGMSCRVRLVRRESPLPAVLTAARRGGGLVDGGAEAMLGVVIALTPDLAATGAGTTEAPYKDIQSGVRLHAWGHHGAKSARLSGSTTARITAKLLHTSLMPVERGRACSMPCTAVWAVKGGQWRAIHFTDPVRQF
jgi:hypothetical protein